MRRNIIGLCVCMLLIITIVPQVSACTGFTYSDEDNVFACHNEDWHNFFNLRFFPATEDRFGSMFIEVYDESIGMLSPFCGINDHGLYYSPYSVPHLEQVNSTDLPDYYDPDSFYKLHGGEYCLFKYSTIEESVQFFDIYNHNAYADFQLLGADNTGNSVINEGDTQVYKKGNFQVATNFRQSHPELGDIANGFERYNITVSMLENITEPSVEYFRDILNATHKHGTSSWTCFSWICDLASQMIYLYYAGDYEKQVVIDLKKELEKGEHYVYLGSLFEPEGNQPPVKPESPTGNESGSTGEEIKYNVKKTSDPEGNKIMYMFDWGDGTQSPWYYNRMGGSVSAYHSWTERGSYEIKVKARDEYGAESEWSDPLPVTMPYSYNRPLFQFWELLLERFPNAFLLIQHLGEL